jgi:hypothetical protein
VRVRIPPVPQTHGRVDNQGTDGVTVAWLAILDIFCEVWLDESGDWLGKGQT